MWNTSGSKETRVILVSLVQSSLTFWDVVHSGTGRIAGIGTSKTRYLLFNKANGNRPFLKYRNDVNAMMIDQKSSQTGNRTPAVAVRARNPDH